MRGRDVFASFPDDLAIGERSFDRRGSGDDLVWAALDRTTAGALQRAWAFGAGRSASRQRRVGEGSEAGTVGASARAFGRTAARRRGLDERQGRAGWRRNWGWPRWRRSAAGRRCGRSAGRSRSRGRATRRRRRPKSKRPSKTRRNRRRGSGAPSRHAGRSLRDRRAPDRPEAGDPPGLGAGRRAADRSRTPSQGECAAFVRASNGST